MSHRALQRAIVRMLFDPELARRVLAGEPIAGLTAEEMRWLREPDARAWRTDPHRRARSLHALLEEFPASAALSGDPRDLIAFFSDDAFHRCIEEGGSLALSFGAWLEARLPAPESDVARIEIAIARVRRARPRGGRGERLALSPKAEVLEADGAASQLHASVLRHVGADAVATLARGPVRGIARVKPWGTREALLVQEKDGAALVERLPDALAALLGHARTPRSRAEILETAQRLGAEPADAEEILEDLLRDGLLTPA